MIFGPICQVGCFSASAAVTSASVGERSAAERSARRGQDQAPHLAGVAAVQALVDRVVLAVDRQHRHAAVAAPRPSRCRRPSPALPCWRARSSCRPRWRASTASSAAVPDEAHSTMSTSGCDATSHRPSLPAPRHLPPASRRAPRAACPSRRRSPSRPRAAGNSSDLLRPSPPTLLAGGERRRPRRDRGCVRRPRRARSVPIDPVEPRMAMRFTCTVQTFRADVREVEHRRGEEQRVDAIEDAAVAGNQRRAVLHVGGALQHRLEQIAGDAGDDDAEAERWRASTRDSAGSQYEPATARNSGAEDEAADRAFAVFFGLIAAAPAACGRTCGRCSTARCR